MGRGSVWWMAVVLLVTWTCTATALPRSGAPAKPFSPEVMSLRPNGARVAQDTWERLAPSIDSRNEFKASLRRYNIRNAWPDAGVILGGIGVAVGGIATAAVLTAAVAGASGMLPVLAGAATFVAVMGGTYTLFRGLAEWNHRRIDSRDADFLAGERARLLQQPTAQMAPAAASAPSAARAQGPSLLGVAAQ